LTDETEHLIEEQPLSTFWGAMVKFGPAIIVGLFYVTVVLHYAYTPDDTYIYLQYAKNLANGNGFAFDANTPSYGITGPLWVLLIAAGAKAGLDPLVVAKTFDILFAGLSIVLVFAMAATLIQNRIYALFAALIFSFDAWFLRWSGSGMETSFAVILVLIAVKYAYLGDYHIAGFVTGLLTLVRPEGVLLFIILQIENFITSYLLGRNKRLFWSSSLLYLVVVLPWVVFSYETFGSIVPNTEFTKTAVHWSTQTVASTAFDSLSVLGSTELLMILLLIVGIPLIISKGGIGTFIAKGMPILWILALLFGCIVLNVQVVSRYLVPVIPLIIIYALWGLKQMELTFRWSPRKALIVLCTIAFATIVQSQVTYRITVVPQIQAIAKGMDRGIKPIALWLRSNSSEDASVLTPAIGMLGYIADREIFDTAGLITPAVKKAFGGVGYDEGMKQKHYRTVVSPDYVVDRAMTKERLASDSLRPIMSTEFGTLGRKKPETIYYTLYKVTQ
jgi:arabinofuranosyltransferase